MAVDAAKEIESSGKKARVVSAVCWELFEDQDESYRNSILPPDVTARVCTSLPLLPPHLKISAVHAMHLYGLVYCGPVPSRLYAYALPVCGLERRTCLPSHQASPWHACTPSARPCSSSA